MGRVSFFQGPHAENKTDYKRVLACEDHPQDCLGEINKMSCFFDVDSQPNQATLRACATKTTTLGSSSALLHALYLNRPKDSEPWTERRVVVLMSGHWDAAGQRDPREYLEGEWPGFVKVVETIRADPETSRMRILFSTGPAFQGSARTTGWRTNFALAAAAAYITREVSAKPELRIELLDPSFFELTLPRQTESLDGTHFLKPEKDQDRHLDNETGEIYFCGGEVGKAFSHLLLNQLCSLYLGL